MWITNAGLTDRHTYDSRPDAWPRLRRGIVSTSLFHLPCGHLLIPDLEFLGQGAQANLSSGQSLRLVS